jgi:hypothetical protein
MADARNHYAATLFMATCNRPLQLVTLLMFGYKQKKLTFLYETFYMLTSMESMRNLEVHLMSPRSEQVKTIHKNVLLNCTNY